MKALIIAAKDFEDKDLEQKWNIAISQGVPAVLQGNNRVRFTERVWIGHDDDGNILIKWDFEDEKTTH